MTLRDLLFRSLSNRLLDCSERILPVARRDWALAMRAESMHIDGNVARLIWSAGCLAAALKERKNIMKTSEISRGVLAIEWVACFGFLVLWGVFEILDLPGLVDGNVDQTLAYLSLRGPLVTAFGGLELFVSALGVVGLVAAYRFLRTGRGIRNRTFTVAIAVGVFLFGLAHVGFDAWSGATAGMTDVWRGFILLSVLPAVGFFHLLYLSKLRNGPEGISPGPY